MAGRGSRFKDTHQVPKPLIDINGKPMIVRALESLGFDGDYHFIVFNDEYCGDTISAITSVIPNPHIIKINSHTDGSARSALLAKYHINNLQELIIANCDQIMSYNPMQVLKRLRENYGSIITVDRKSTRLNSSHTDISRMPSSA